MLSKARLHDERPSIGVVIKMLVQRFACYFRFRERADTAALRLFCLFSSCHASNSLAVAFAPKIALARDE
jgi:hypothetical protein